LLNEELDAELDELDAELEESAPAESSSGPADGELSSLDGLDELEELEELEELDELAEASEAGPTAALPFALAGLPEGLWPLLPGDPAGGEPADKGALPPGGLWAPDAGAAEPLAGHPGL